ncbi:hypothetical protein B8T70_19945 [Flavobacterium sp. AJR]|nr:hypothetical protein B8T70_19945 [Flavobacterium sp. AJR]
MIWGGLVVEFFDKDLVKSLENKILLFDYNFSLKLYFNQICLLLKIKPSSKIIDQKLQYLLENIPIIGIFDKI